MRKAKLLLLAVLPMCLSGCWDGKDPEDRDYMITMGVEKGEEGLKFTFAPAGEEQVFSVENDTLTGAAAEAEWTRSSEVYLGQLKNIVFGKSLLEDPVAFAAVLDELERGFSISEKVMILGTSQSAAECVSAIGEEDRSTGLFLWDFYKNTAEEVAVTRGVDLDIFLTELREQGGSGVLPRIEKEENLTLGGGIVLADGKYAFSLSPEEEQARLLLAGEGTGAVLQQFWQDTIIPMEVRKNRVSYDFWQEEDGMVCLVSLRITGALGGSGGTEVFSAQKREELENLFSAFIKSHLENTIKVVQNQTAGDVFGLEAEMKRQGIFPGEKDFTWQDLRIFVACQVSLQDTGRTK